MLITKLLTGLGCTLVLSFVALEAKHSKGSENDNADILLILGCRVRGDNAEETLSMRIERASAYLKQHPDTIAIACGGIVHDDQNISEAQVIKRELILSGIEENRIILEDKSLTTKQNFINAKAIIKSMPDFENKKIAFLSSDFHLLRAQVLAKMCKLSCDTVAADSPKNLKVKNYVREFFVFPFVLINN